MKNSLQTLSPAGQSALLVVWGVLCACADGVGSGLIDPAIAPPQPIDPWSRVIQTIDAHPLENFALIVGGPEGEVFRYEKGSFRLDDVHPVASASKWLTGATFMALVQQGVMQLDDRPQKYLSYWTNDPGDPRSQITLEQLLSFTAGFHTGPADPGCIAEPSIALQACVETLYAQGVDAPPGTTYFYGPVHMQVAAAMAEVATGQSWAEIVQLSVAIPLNLSVTGFPAGNTRVSGSAFSSALDYAAFARAQLNGWPSAQAVDELARDRLDGVTIVSQPDALEAGGGDWSYGLGVWRECSSVVWSEACEEHVVLSSAGAFGWYPWLDLNNGYYAVLAMREQPTLFYSPSTVSVELGQSLQPLIVDALLQ